MTNLFDDTYLAGIWSYMALRVAAAVEDGHYLEDTLENRRRLAEADDLARELEDD